jgi:membrane protease YdiL (CAAX protease family)
VTTTKLPQIPRSTIATSWRWLKIDFLTRVVPLAIVPLLYVALFHRSLVSIGLTIGNLPQHMLTGLLVGTLMAALAVLYRMYIVGPWFRRPTLPDHLFQACYYLCINAPVEELFFRGFLLSMITQWTGWLGWGWLVSTATYTLYHRLGKWSWRSVGGVGLAGIIFSLIYLLQPSPRSLLAVTIVHGLTTCGFLSWGSEALYQRWQRRQNSTG